MSLSALLQELVAIPSFIDGTHTESRAADYTFNLLSELPFFTVEKQEFSVGRYNIVACTHGESRLLIAGHLDTVCPAYGWNSDPLVATENGDRIVGLGAVDTKGGIAALLVALRSFTKVEGLTVLLYGDEEYGFGGMRQYVRDGGAGKNALAIVIEPTNTQLWNAHRGLIEFRVAARGKAGHAANPSSGINAIDRLYTALSDVRQELQRFSSSALGKTTMNVASLHGGSFRGVDEHGAAIIGVQANSIPDYASAVVDIRPADPELRGATIEQMIRDHAMRAGITIENFFCTHDLGAMYTDPAALRDVEDVVRRVTGSATYIDASKKGYSDGQLIAESAKIPVVYLGPTGGNAHGPNEWVETHSLTTLANMYSELIRLYCGAK